jgi:hypothetical protein
MVLCVSLACAVGAGFAEDFMTMWGNAESHTVILSNGSSFLVQEPEGRRGPYSTYFPGRPYDASTRVVGWEAAGKDLDCLVAAGNLRFGPYKIIKTYAEDMNRKSALFAGLKPDGETDFLFYDGLGLSRIASASLKYYDSISYADFGGDGHFACVLELKEGGNAVLLGNGLMMGLPGRPWFGTFLGDGDRYWLALPDRDGRYRLVGIDPAGSADYYEKLGKELMVASAGVVAKDLVTHLPLINAALSPSGIDRFGQSDFSSPSAPYLKYRSGNDLFIFTGREILGPFWSPDQDRSLAWLKDEAPVFPDAGPGRMFSFPKDHERYLDMNGAIYGPIDYVISMAFVEEGGKQLPFALVMKGGKAYALLDGREIGGPWETAKGPESGRSGPYFMGRSGGAWSLFRLGTRLSALPPGVSLKECFEIAGRSILVLQRAEEGKPRRFWYRVDGIDGPEFDWPGLVPLVSPDGTTVVYAAGMMKSSIVVNGEVLGPFDGIGDVILLGNDCYFSALSGKKWTMMKGSKPFVDLGKEEVDPYGSMSISSDGSVICFPGRYVDKKSRLVYSSSRLVLDGKIVSGYRDPESGAVLLWEAKAKTVTLVGIRK